MLIVVLDEMAFGRIINYCNIILSDSFFMWMRINNKIKEKWNDIDWIISIWREYM